MRKKLFGNEADRGWVVVVVVVGLSCDIVKQVKLVL